MYTDWALHIWFSEVLENLYHLQFSTEDFFNFVKNSIMFVSDIHPERMCFHHLCTFNDKNAYYMIRTWKREQTLILDARTHRVCVPLCEFLMYTKDTILFYRTRIKCISVVFNSTAISIIMPSNRVSVVVWNRSSWLFYETISVHFVFFFISCLGHNTQIDQR